MDNFNRSESPIFSQELEELISESSVDLNKHTLQKFLTNEHLPALTQSILDGDEWNIFSVATASIFLENRSDDLLDCFLETLGNFIYYDDEKREQIEKAILEGFSHALPDQREKTINILNKLQEQFSTNDAFIPSLFYEKLKNNL